LVGKVLAARVGRVEVALDHHAQTSPHDAVTVAPAKRSLHPRDAFVRHALQQADVEVDLVPLDDGAGDLHERQAHGGLPVLGTLQHQVVHGVAQLGVEADVGIGKVVGLSMMFRVVLQLLGAHRRAEKVGEGGQHVFAAGGERLGLRSRHVFLFYEDPAAGRPIA